MQPDLEPSFAFEQNFSRSGNGSAGIERQLRVRQSDPAPAKEQAAHFGRVKRLGNEALDFVDHELDRGFIVDAPAAPFLVAESGEHSQHWGLDLLGGWPNLEPIRVSAAQSLVG